MILHWQDRRGYSLNIREKSEKTGRQLEERPVPKRYNAVLATTTNRVAVDDPSVPW